MPCLLRRCFVVLAILFIPLIRNNRVYALGAGSGGINAPRIRSVGDYGAVGDGQTDDTRAIQMALDAGFDGIWSNIGKVYFPGGKTYRVSHRLIFWAGTYLESDAANPATLLVSSNTPAFQNIDNVRHVLMSRLSAMRPDCPENPTDGPVNGWPKESPPCTLRFIGIIIFGRRCAI